MNNHTTARKPLRQSENSHLLAQRLLEEPIPSPVEPAATVLPSATSSPTHSQPEGTTP